MYELTDAERAEVRAEFLEEQRKQAKAAYRKKLEQAARIEQGYQCTCAKYPDHDCDVHD